MDDLRRRSSWSLVLAVLLVAAGGTRAGATPYYNVTDVNSLTSAQYAALFPTTPDVPLTQAQRFALPTVPMVIYRTDQQIQEPLVSLSYKGGETVVGEAPYGYAIPTYGIIGYTQMQPDGTFGSFVRITTSEQEDEYDHAILNANNQILLMGPLNPRIIDLNTGTVTDFNSIISPSMWQQYYSIVPIDLADNGSILADYQAYGPGGNTLVDGQVILSPPNVPLAASAPEPTALLTILAGLAGFAVRNRWGRRS